MASESERKYTIQLGDFHPERDGIVWGGSNWNGYGKEEAEELAQARRYEGVGRMMKGHKGLEKRIDAAPLAFMVARMKAPFYRVIDPDEAYPDFLLYDTEDRKTYGHAREILKNRMKRDRRI